LICATLGAGALGPSAVAWGNAIVGARTSCATKAADSVSCFGEVVTVNGQTYAPGLVAGYVPENLHSAYNLPWTGGQGQTVAVVDAYDDPSAESDLGVYRAAFGLPACTTANGCFTKVNQEGKKTHYPKTDPKASPANGSWEEEEANDLDMVSAVCPQCHLLLVESNNQGNASMSKAQETAAGLGANVISDSWGGVESKKTAGYTNVYFQHPGIAQVSGTPDTGYGVSWPASAPNLTAVGATTLTRDSSARGWSETVWNDLNNPNLWGSTGSGCSINQSKPTWQTDKGCSNRTDNDVTAVGDPGTPVAVYNTFIDPGWIEFGGTSVSTPIVAGIYGLAGNAQSLDGAALTYTNAKDLYDITVGDNLAPGKTCAPTYLCTAGKGYDGPSGNGSPNGIGAF